MSDDPIGRALIGSADELRAAYERFDRQAVDQVMPIGPPPTRRQTTLNSPCSVTGPGTFFARADRTLTFEPTEREGWWFDRVDQPDSLPIRVCVENVWTTARNIVLRSGSQHNYVRMVEHMIAFQRGLGLDNVIVRLDSGDPPLFELGSKEIHDAFRDSGLRELDRPKRYVTVKETATVATANGGFLTFAPATGPDPVLEIDCAVNFATAIGQQRIQFTLDADSFDRGVLARTNTTVAKMLYCKTIGKIFADVRHLGYTSKNILIAGKGGYHNAPRLLFDDKSLEAVWHRAILDLVAALSLIDRGCFVGAIRSYKAGHTDDVQLIKKLYMADLITEFVPT